MWTVFAVACILATTPKLLRFIRNGRAWQGWGIWEDIHGNAYKPVQESDKEPRPKRTASRAWISLTKNRLLWKIPYLNLDIGQRKLCFFDIN